MKHQNVVDQCQRVVVSFVLKLGKETLLTGPFLSENKMLMTYCVPELVYRCGQVPIKKLALDEAALGKAAFTKHV